MANAQAVDYVREHGLAIMAGDGSESALALAAANYSMMRLAYWDDARDKLTRFCNCKSTLVEFYFRNPGTGAHGWMCGKCKGITQTG